MCLFCFYAEIAEGGETYSVDGLRGFNPGTWLHFFFPELKENNTDRSVHQVQNVHYNQEAERQKNDPE